MNSPSTAFKIIHVAIATCFLSVLLPAAPSQAQAIEWINVPNVIVPASVGRNTIARGGDQITFDAIADGQYVRYNGNCRAEVLYRMKIGSLDQNRQPQNVEPYPNERWFSASEYQSSILAVACKTSS